MKPIYVPFAGDLFEVHFDKQGEIAEVYVRRDNCSRPPMPMELGQVPLLVKARALDEFLDWEHRH